MIETSDEEKATRCRWKEKGVKKITKQMEKRCARTPAFLELLDHSLLALFSSGSTKYRRGWRKKTNQKAHKATGMKSERKRKKTFQGAATEL